MTYSWEPYKEEMYRLYVTEGKPLDEVIEYFRAHHNFMPSRRGFQVQFSRWKFPPKYSPVHKNTRLIARVRDLWARGVPHAEQLRILTEEEGYSLTTLQLRHLRLKQGLLLREPAEPLHSKRWRQQLRRKSQRGVDGAGEGGAQGEGEGGEAEEEDGEHERERAHEGGEEEEEEEEDDSDDGEGDEDSDSDGRSDSAQRHRSATGERNSGNNSSKNNEHPGSVDGLSRIPEDLLVPEHVLTPAELAQREQRRREIEAESYEKYVTKKRRRRIKGWSGLPADPPGPPRYPSETSLIEVKMILQLDTAAYNTLRESFQRICEEEGIIKKTLAGPERWEAAKERLVRESMHLRAVMWDQDNMTGKKLAIDCLACDVTKRMRVAGNRMTVASARCVLGINPEQGRDVRFALCKIMAEDRFVGKLEAGKEHWDELKRRWIAECDCLNRLFANGFPDPNLDPEDATRIKAVDMLARDAMRRWVDRTGKKAAAKAVSAERKAAREAERLAKKEAAKEAAAAHAAAAAAAAKASKAIEVEAAAVAAAATPKRGRGRPPKAQKIQDQVPPPQPRQQQQQRQGPGASFHSQARLVPMDLDPAPEPDLHSDAGPEPGSDPDLTPDNMLPMSPRLSSFDSGAHNPFVDDQYIQGYAAAQQIQAEAAAFSMEAPPPAAPAPAASSTMVVYFRLHPSSTVVVPGTAESGGSSNPPSTTTTKTTITPKRTMTWISMLDAQTMEELRSVAASRFPASLCRTVQGIVKDGKGGELPLPVGDDEELLAYLQHVEGRGAPTFSVQLVRTR